MNTFQPIIDDMPSAEIFRRFLDKDEQGRRPPPFVPIESGHWVSVRERLPERRMIPYHTLQDDRLGGCLNAYRYGPCFPYATTHWWGHHDPADVAGEGDIIC